MPRSAPRHPGDPGGPESYVEWSEPENPFNPCGGTRHGHAGFLEWARIGNETEDVLMLKPGSFWPAVTRSQSSAARGAV